MIWFLILKIENGQQVIYLVLLLEEDIMSIFIREEQVKGNEDFILYNTIFSHGQDFEFDVDTIVTELKNNGYTFSKEKVQDFLDGCTENGLLSYTTKGYKI